jgi:hypothetical protein
LNSYLLLEKNLRKKRLSPAVPGVKRFKSRH